MQGNKTNVEIRQKAKAAGVHLWQVGEALGMNDANFSRKLRHELSANDKERALAAIDRLSANKQEVTPDE